VPKDLDFAVLLRVVFSSAVNIEIWDKDLKKSMTVRMLILQMQKK
jgi:hypothetical protein